MLEWTLAHPFLTSIIVVFAIMGVDSMFCNYVSYLNNRAYYRYLTEITEVETKEEEE